MVPDRWVLPEEPPDPVPAHQGEAPENIRPVQALIKVEPPTPEHPDRDARATKTEGPAPRQRLSLLYESPSPSNFHRPAVSLPEHVPKKRGGKPDDSRSASPPSGHLVHDELQVLQPARTDAGLQAKIRQDHEHHRPLLRPKLKSVGDADSPEIQ